MKIYPLTQEKKHIYIFVDNYDNTNILLYNTIYNVLHTGLYIEYDTIN